MRLVEDFDIKNLDKYGFTIEDDLGEEHYVWNEDANISINLLDRTIFVYGWDEESYQDLSVLYRMFKDGVLESLEVEARDE